MCNRRRCVPTRVAVTNRFAVVVVFRSSKTAAAAATCVRDSKAICATIVTRATDVYGVTATCAEVRRVLTTTTNQILIENLKVTKIFPNKMCFISVIEQITHY